jgi:hypothetical protein
VYRKELELRRKSNAHDPRKIPGNCTIDSCVVGREIAVTNDIEDRTPEWVHETAENTTERARWVPRAPVASFIPGQIAVFPRLLGLGWVAVSRQGKGPATDLVSFANREEKKYEVRRYTVTVSPGRTWRAARALHHPSLPVAAALLLSVSQANGIDNNFVAREQGKGKTEGGPMPQTRPRHCASQPRNLVPDCPLSESTNALAGNVVHPRLHTRRSPGAQTQVFSPEPISGHQSEPPGAV